jgi:hypothetical protein
MRQEPSFFIAADRGKSGERCTTIYVLIRREIRPEKHVLDLEIERDFAAASSYLTLSKTPQKGSTTLLPL